MAQKRRAGDRWGVVCFDLDTGQKKHVIIGGCEHSTFPYASQAQDYVDWSNEQTRRNVRYEIEYQGNWKD